MRQNQSTVWTTPLPGLTFFSPFEKYKILISAKGLCGNMAKGLKHSILWLFLGFVALLYLGNLGAGIVELGPDNIPVAGNIDEFIASAILLKSLAELKLFNIFGKSKDS